MALDLAFDAGTLSRLRKAVFDEAAGAGMPNHRAADVVIAVHELAANAVRHGAGGGLLTMRVQAADCAAGSAIQAPNASTGTLSGPSRPGSRGLSSVAMDCGLSGRRPTRSPWHPGRMATQ
jgi:hypothetical protein